MAGITLFETVNEVTHRLMVAEALSKGLTTRANAKRLRENFELISTLTDYWKNVERLLALNLLFLAGERGHSQGRKRRTGGRWPTHERLDGRFLHARVRAFSLGHERRGLRACCWGHSF